MIIAARSAGRTWPGEVFEQARTDSRPRLCHLLALPGMLICCVPLNIVVPLMYWKNHEESRTIRRHVTEVLNFQLLWSAVLAPLFSLPFVSDIMLWPFVWFGGMVMVLFLAYEAGNGGDGRYLVRIPLFK